MKIAISGFAGSGKTTLAKALAEKLGDVKLVLPSFKDLAAKRGISLKEFQKLAEENPEIDREFDEWWLEEVKKYENVIIASWLAIWLFDADLKVFLHAQLEKRAKRIALRENKSFEEALRETKERDEDNRRRYLRLYGIDIYDNSVAHLSLNTEYYSIEEEVMLILESLRIKNLI